MARSFYLAEWVVSRVLFLPETLLVPKHPISTPQHKLIFRQNQLVLSATKSANRQKEGRGADLRVFSGRHRKVGLFLELSEKKASRLLQSARRTKRA